MSIQFDLKPTVFSFILWGFIKFGQNLTHTPIRKMENLFRVTTPYHEIPFASCLHPGSIAPPLGRDHEEGWVDQRDVP